MLKRCLFIIAVVLVFFCSFSNSRAAEKKKYVLGIRVGMSTETDAQYKTMITDMSKIYSQNHDTVIETRWYVGDAEFMNAVKKNEPDVVFLYNYDPIYALKKIYGFSVFMTLSAFGRETPKACIYVAKNSPVKNIADLHGKTAATYNYACEYYLLRDLLGEKPEKFFGELKPVANGVSTIYELAMGSVDASFTYDVTVEMMQKNNPGPVKKIRQLACTKEFGFFPLLVSKKAPPDTIAVFNDFLGNSYKNAEFKKYQPLFKLYGMRFVPSSDADFKYIYELFNKAGDGKWKKDYDKWLTYAQENR
jgi:ABC-type phosphate/phosphonate transport system substrate-binding protein